MSFSVVPFGKSLVRLLASKHRKKSIWKLKVLWKEAGPFTFPLPELRDDPLVRSLGKLIFNAVIEHRSVKRELLSLGCRDSYHFIS
jgi:hypothetical protein